MNNKIKRSISWLLTICMILTVFVGVMFTTATAASVSNQIQLQNALSNASPGEVITLTDNIVLTSTLYFNKNISITINGGKTISADYTVNNWINKGGSDTELLNISGSGNITIVDTTFNAWEMCRNILVEPGSSTLTLTGCTIESGYVHSSTHGAGINVQPGNIVNISGGTMFRNNVAHAGSPCSGGGVYANGENTKIIIDNATFHSNQAHSGGAIYTYAATVTCTANTQFINNNADQRGGAIHSHGIVILDGTEIKGQSSGQYGGAIYISGSLASYTGTVVLKNATITGNEASANGGGIYMASDTELYIVGDTNVTGNNNAESSDNVYISSGATLINAGIGSGGAIGVSTSNPFKHKVLVNSLVSNKTFDKAGVTLSTYSMNANKGDYPKFTYDAELWKLQESTDSGNQMWLDYNYEFIGGGGNGYVVFDFNLPGAAAVTSSKAAGESVDIPVLSNMTVGAVTYVFKGWYTAASGGTKLTGSTVTATGGLDVYYAQWDVDTSGGGGGTPVSGNMYLVYFYENYTGGGLTAAYITAGNFSFTVIVEGYPQTISVSIPFSFPGDPYRLGYTFLGWSLNVTGTSTINKGSWSPTQAVSTLYALWEPNAYTLTWNANGGAGGTTTTQAHDTTVAPPATAPTRTGYTFTGWFVDKACSVPLASGTVVTGAATYYAGWLSNEYSIVWDTNYTGGSVATVQQRYDDALMVQPDPVRSGYFFAGWWSQPGGTGSQATPSTKVTGNATYYAYWVTETMSYAVTLEWADKSDNDAVRPDSVTVELLRNGLSTGQSYTFSSSSFSGDVWTHSFVNLPVADAVSNNYVYSVAVTSSVTSEYTYAADFSSNAYAGYILLTHTLITRDINVYIAWDDKGDNDGYRPTSVDVQLCANGAPIADAEARLSLSGTGEVWTYSFSHMNKYFAGGQEIVYTIIVTPTNVGELNKYSTAYNNLTATLTHSIDTVSRTIITEWQDNNNQDGMRPASMTAQLYANNQPVQGKYVTLSDGNSWSYTWSGLPKYSNGGVPVVYSTYVTSTLVDYVAATTEMTIEMTYTPSATRIGVFISWTDEQNADGLRPDYITVELISNGIPTGDKQQLSATNNWRTEWQNYPIYDEGQRIEYTFAVSPLPNGYLAEYFGIYDTSGLSAVLTHTRIRADYTAEIEWNDNDNIAGARMGMVRVMLYADGSPLETYTAILTEGTGWAYTFENFPVYRDEGEIIKYSTYVISDIGKYEVVTNGMTITLGLAVQTVDIPLSILWDDDSNAMGMRPSFVAVTLSIDGVASIYSIAATAANNWTVTFEGFPKYNAGGIPLNYGALVTIPNGYEVTYIGQAAVLSTTTEAADYTATVIWQDNDNQYGQRPSKATLTLLADYGDGNGFVSTGTVKTVYAADDWECTFNNLPAFTSGRKIVYSVAISGDIGNYTAYNDGLDTYMKHKAITDSEDSGYTTEYTAKIIWVDNANALNSRSYGAILTLYANGVEFSAYTITENDISGGYTWEYTWTDLPTSIAGKTAVYTVGMTALHGYKASVVGDTITLTQVKDITISIAWQDNGNKDGKRPQTLTLDLFADGVKKQSQTQPNGNADETVFVFKDMPIWSTVNTTQKINYTYDLPTSERTALANAGYSLKNSGNQPVTDPETGNSIYSPSMTYTSKPTPPTGGGSGGGGGTGGNGGGGGSTGGNSGNANETDGTLVKAYINGYPDGAFRPDASISRAEVAAIISRVSAGFNANGYYTLGLTDVSYGDWFATNLGYCLSEGIITGYPDGTFRPDNAITRAEIASIAARMLNLKNTGASNFTDTSGNWADGYISKLTAKGIITGYPDGTFRPDAAISRAEAVTIINRVLDRTPDTGNLAELVISGAAIFFTDVAPSYWAYYQILEAANNHYHN